MEDEDKTRKNEEHKEQKRYIELLKRDEMDEQQQLVEFYPTKFKKDITMLTGIVMDDNYGFIHVHEFDKWYLVKDYGENGENVLNAFLSNDYSEFEESDNVTSLGNMYCINNMFNRRFTLNKCDVGIEELNELFLYCEVEIAHGKNKTKITNYSFVHGLITEIQFGQLNKLKSFVKEDFVIVDKHPIARLLELRVSAWS